MALELAEKDKYDVQEIIGSYFPSFISLTPSDTARSWSFWDHPQSTTETGWTCMRSLLDASRAQLTTDA